MKRKYSLTLLGSALVLALPLSTQAESIFANDMNGDVEKAVKSGEVIEKVFATQNHIATVTGPNISVHNTNKGSQYAIQANRLATDNGPSKAIIGDHSTGTVNIKTDFGDAIRSNHSNIEVYGKEISVEGSSTALHSYSNYDEGSNITIGTDSTESVSLSSVSDVQTNGYGIYAAGINSRVNVLGKTIKVSASKTGEAQGAYEGIDAINGARVSIGSQNTSSLSVDGSVGMYVGGADSSVSLRAKNINIDAVKVGVWTQNSTDYEQGSENAAQVSILGEQTNISAPQGIVAYSNSKVTIDSDLIVNSEEAAIVARGHSSVTINSRNAKSTVINGDIVFMSTSPDGKSGNLIDADVSVNLNNENSIWTGRSYQTFKNNSGEMIEVVDLDNGNDYYGNVTGFDLKASNGGTWNVTGDSFVNDIEVANGASINMHSDTDVLNVDGLVVDNASVNMQGGENQKVSVNKLAARSASLNMKASTKDGKSIQTGQFEVLESVEEGSDLGVTLTGITSDDIQDAQAAMDSVKNTVVAKGATIEKTIVEGDVRGAITETTAADGSRSIAKTAENTKLLSMKGVNAAALVAWRDEVAYTNQRMEFLRDNSHAYGAWAQVYGGESAYDDASVDLTTTTVQVGADATIGDWVAGAAFSYMSGDADMSNGQADTDAYTLSLYASRMFDSGLFVNGLARYGRLSTDATAGNMDGSYDNNAFSVGGNVGYRFTFAEQAFVEPMFGLQYAYVTGDDYKASNGVKVEQDDFDALIASLGVRTGFDFAKDAGKLYARASVNHDFLGEVDGKASKGSLAESMYVDLGGTWFTYGVGTQFNITDNLSVWGNVDRTTGGEVSTRYMMNAGLRYVF